IAPSTDNLQDRLDTIKEYEDELAVLLTEKNKESFFRTIDEKLLNASIADYTSRLEQERKPYQYVEIHPISMFSVAGSVIPFINLNQATRVSYQTKTEPQGLSTARTNPHRYEGTTLTMAYPVQPIIHTVLKKPVGMATHPKGANVVLMINAFSGFNQEDAFIFNKDSIDRGLFTYVKEFIYETRLNNTQEFTQKLKRPIVEEGEEDRYRYINMNGLPSIGAELKPGDCVIGKVQVDNVKDRVPDINVSEYISVNDQGTVVDVRVVEDDKKPHYMVKLRSERQLIIGDKYAFTPCQKATIGAIFPE